MPLGTLPKGQQSKGYHLVSRIDISFGNLLRAAYTAKSKFMKDSGDWQKETGDRIGGPVVNQDWNQFPSFWWNWAWIKMIPSWQGRTNPIIYPIHEASQKIDDTASTLSHFIGFYQLYKHVKTTMAVLNTYNGPFVDNEKTYGHLRQTSILASLLTQDNYIMARENTIYNDKYAQPACLIEKLYFNFGELTAWGAPWAFPPGQRGTSRGLFNHHSMTGTNDPMADPWQPLDPPPPRPISQNYPESTVDKVIGSLHLANFTEFTPNYTMGTASALAAGGDADTSAKWEYCWAVVRVKSKWMLGNLRPYERMKVKWDIDA